MSQSGRRSPMRRLDAMFLNLVPTDSRHLLTRDVMYLRSGSLLLLGIQFVKIALEPFFQYAFVTTTNGKVIRSLFVACMIPAVAMATYGVLRVDKSTTHIAMWLLVVMTLFFPAVGITIGTLFPDSFALTEQCLWVLNVLDAVSAWHLTKITFTLLGRETAQARFSVLGSRSDSISGTAGRRRSRAITIATTEADLQAVRDVYGENSEEAEVRRSLPSSRSHPSSPIQIRDRPPQYAQGVPQPLREKNEEGGKTPWYRPRAPVLESIKAVARRGCNSPLPDSLKPSGVPEELLVGSKAPGGGSDPSSRGTPEMKRSAEKGKEKKYQQLLAPSSPPLYDEAVQAPAQYDSGGSEGCRGVEMGVVRGRGLYSEDAGQGVVSVSLDQECALGAGIGMGGVRLGLGGAGPPPLLLSGSEVDPLDSGSSDEEEGRVEGGDPLGSNFNLPTSLPFDDHEAGSEDEIEDGLPRYESVVAADETHGSPTHSLWYNNPYCNALLSPTQQVMDTPNALGAMGVLSPIYRFASPSTGLLSPMGSSWNLPASALGAPASAAFHNPISARSSPRPKAITYGSLGPASSAFAAATTTEIRRGSIAALAGDSVPPRAGRPYPYSPYMGTNRSTPAIPPPTPILPLPSSAVRPGLNQELPGPTITSNLPGHHANFRVTPATPGEREQAHRARQLQHIAQLPSLASSPALKVGKSPELGVFGVGMARPGLLVVPALSLPVGAASVEGESQMEKSIGAALAGRKVFGGREGGVEEDGEEGTPNLGDSSESLPTFELRNSSKHIRRRILAISKPPRTSLSSLP